MKAQLWGKQPALWRRASLLWPPYLFRVGCGVGFRDWYIAEGGSEGPRKLQVYKALDEGYALRGAEETAWQLLAFLERSPRREQGELEEAARRRAFAVLGELKLSDPGLAQRVRQVLQP